MKALACETCIAAAPPTSPYSSRTLLRIVSKIPVSVSTDSAARERCTSIASRSRAMAFSSALYAASWASFTARACSSASWRAAAAASSALCVTAANSSFRPSSAAAVSDAPLPVSNSGAIRSDTLPLKSSSDMPVVSIAVTAAVMLARCSSDAVVPLPIKLRTTSRSQPAAPLPKSSFDTSNSEAVNESCSAWLFAACALDAAIAASTCLRYCARASGASKSMSTPYLDSSPASCLRALSLRSFSE